MPMLPIEAMLIFQTDMFMDDDRKGRACGLWAGIVVIGSGHVPQRQAR